MGWLRPGVSHVCVGSAYSRRIRLEVEVQAAISRRLVFSTSGTPP